MQYKNGKLEMNSIWSCFEIYCIACDFEYEQYVAMHEANDIGGAMLNKPGYEALGAFFDIQYSNDISIDIEPEDFKFWS